MMNTSLKKKLENFSAEQLEQRKEFTCYCYSKPAVNRNGGSTPAPAPTPTPPRGDTGGGIPF
ncbi:hypothetical protein ODZ84_00405 [Chryseobacterium fluminis]|uniref:hypothetical protein n=1 Tax=Chryseobacterium fluminis TaxID=2983606 RepID=UPI00225666E0|nr:hypothetical protein [Chryseobacterium sp. MMS21-Ot14]UZT98065.1 hypothetical protein ODZ84_00405 [Chryseobacterium sp. MMS21-Ot14]